MGVKEQLLLMKLKGELTFNEITGLETLISAHEEKFNSIGFDLTGLNLIDSSGTGFLINQYNSSKEKNKKVKFFFKGEERSVTTNDELLKLCVEIFQSHPVAIPEKKERDTTDHVRIQKETPQPAVEPAIINEKTTKKTVSDESYLIDKKMINYQEEENNRKAPLFQKFKTTENILTQSVYIPGVVFGLLLIISLFLPQIDFKGITIGWKLVIKGSSGLGVLGTLLIGSVMVIISLLPHFSLIRRAPIMLVLGTAGIILWYHYMSYDVVAKEVMAHYAVYYKGFAQLIIAAILTGTMLLFTGKHPQSLFARIILGITLIFLVAAYIIPFKETKSFILTGINTRIMVKELVMSIDRSKNLLELVFNVYLLIPLFLGLISVLVYFTKQDEHNGIAEFCGKILLAFFPFFIFAGAVYSGLQNISSGFFTHILFIAITLSVFIAIFSRGFLVAFSPDGPNFLFNTIENSDIKKKTQG